MKHLFLAVAASALVACDWNGPPDGAVLVTPPAVYATWWAQVQECSGRSRDMRVLRWFRVPGSSFARENGHVVGGVYSPGGNYIALSDTLAANSAAVRHEMLHALTDVRGHPREQFLGSCAGLVDCRDSCVADAGSWNAPAPFSVLPAESLLVETTIELPPATDDGERWMIVRITVTNPKSSPILVEPIGMRLGFNAIVASIGGGREYSPTPLDSSTFYFGAGEKKEKFLDFRVAEAFGTYAIPAGEYLVDGGFGQHYGPSKEVSVSR